jgi:hypothetical protein
MENLIKIQSELKAPKGQVNSFGNYKYRSAEDILEAVKPLLTKYGCTLTLSDELVFVGERHYVKATATLISGETSVSTTAYAREALSKKGMDESQITGMASSYARKYALNGLFCIDDTRDADTMNNNEEQASKPAKKDYAISPEIIDQYDMAILNAIGLVEAAKRNEELKEIWEASKDKDHRGELRKAIVAKGKELKS